MRDQRTSPFAPWREYRAKALTTCLWRDSSPPPPPNWTHDRPNIRISSPGVSGAASGRGAGVAPSLRGAGEGDTGAVAGGGGGEGAARACGFYNLSSAKKRFHVAIK